MVDAIKVYDNFREDRLICFAELPEQNQICSNYTSTIIYRYKIWLTTVYLCVFSAIR